MTKPLRIKIQEASHKQSAPQPIIEKDYALSYILYGITQQTTLSNSLIFKGGTALKKIYFGDYRFSEDLDFSVNLAPKGTELEAALQDAIQIAETALRAYGPFEVQLKRKAERAPHPTGQDAFSIAVKFPWQQGTACSIKVEITHDELLVLPTIKKPIMHGYEEQIETLVNCYCIEEIIAEKLRALLQTHQKLITKGWNRPRARDYYDLWRLFKQYHADIDRKNLLHALQKKCIHREITFNTIDDFFTEELVKEAHRHWQATLGGLVKDLPECALVLDELKALITEFIINTSGNYMNLDNNTTSTTAESSTIDKDTLIEIAQKEGFELEHKVCNIFRSDIHDFYAEQNFLPNNGPPIDVFVYPKENRIPSARNTAFVIECKGTNPNNSLLLYGKTEEFIQANIRTYQGESYGLCDQLRCDSNGTIYSWLPTDPAANVVMVGYNTTKKCDIMCRYVYTGDFRRDQDYKKMPKQDMKNNLYKGLIQVAQGVSNLEENIANIAAQINSYINVIPLIVTNAKIYIKENESDELISVPWAIHECSFNQEKNPKSIKYVFIVKVDELNTFIKKFG